MVDVSRGVIIDEESATVGADIVFPVVSLGDSKDGVALFISLESGYEVELSDGSFGGENPKVTALVGNELQAVDPALYGSLWNLQRFRTAPYPYGTAALPLRLQQQ